MKKTIFLLLVATLPFSCKKDTVDISQIKGTMDMKDLSLPQLKTFLKGKWRWQYSVIYNFGGFRDTTRLDGLKDYIVFPSPDSIIQLSETTNTAIREGLIYERSEIPGDPDHKKVYVLKFDDDGYGYRSLWVADRLMNDTLVFVNYFRSEGFNSYHFTREQE
jgi:hypothetical protein